MNIVRLSLALVLVAWTCTSVAAWQTASRDGDGSASSFPVAFTTNDRGHRAEVFKDKDGRVYLRFIRNQGLQSFALNSCPTFQIDQRTPMHYYEVGEQCTIENKKVTVFLGQILNARITSLVLHRFMNGRQVAFRYTTEDGRYHESLFKLNNSKQVLRTALGFDTRISPE